MMMMMMKVISSNVASMSHSFTSNDCCVSRYIYTYTDIFFLIYTYIYISIFHLSARLRACMRKRSFSELADNINKNPNQNLRTASNKWTDRARKKNCKSFTCLWNGKWKLSMHRHCSLLPNCTISTPFPPHQHWALFEWLRKKICVYANVWLISLYAKNTTEPRSGFDSKENYMEMNFLMIYARRKKCRIFFVLDCLIARGKMKRMYWKCTECTHRRTRWLLPMRC